MYSLNSPLCKLNHAGVGLPGANNLGFAAHKTAMKCVDLTFMLLSNGR